jgi:hypothetical protein
MELISIFELDNLVAVERRLRIETAIQKEAEKLEAQVPVSSKLAAKYQNLAHIAMADKQAETVFQRKVNSLAQQSVDDRAVAVADMTKVLLPNRYLLCDVLLT